MLYPGKFSRPRVAERRLRRPMTSATGTHSSARYRGAKPCEHLNTSRHSLDVMRCAMSSQCRSLCRSRVRPRWNFRVPLVTRAAYSGSKEELTLKQPSVPPPIGGYVSPGVIICHIAIAYSMGQIIKYVCVCQCVSVSVYLPSASTLTVAFLDRFSPKLAQT